ncbi:Uncharacterised protein [Lysinibacillus sphaericus]|nr:Uncharacterised protein [Lysinibacillus sphaericus]
MEEKSPEQLAKEKQQLYVENQKTENVFEDKVFEDKDRITDEQNAWKETQPKRM